MKLLCIKNSIGEIIYPLEVNKIYEGDLVYYDAENPNPYLPGNEVEWENNKISIDEFNTFDWFPTSLFLKMPEAREHRLNELGI